MIGKYRVACLLLVVVALLIAAVGGPAVAVAGPRLADDGSTAEIDGPLHLSLTVSPPISTPRDTVTLTLVLSNPQAEAATPELSLHLPASLAPRGQRFPASTTFNYRENALNWLPILPAGESATLTLPFAAAVADLTQPEQTASVRVRDGDWEEEASVSFWTGLPPTAGVAAHPAVVAVGEAVQLEAAVGGAGPFTQSWDLGDGRHVSARDPVVVYAEPGTYEVTLQVANPLAVATASGTVTVVAQPFAAFTVDDERPVVEQAVQFSDESGGQPPLSYLWDFGDGSGSDERHPSHKYSAAGNYEVRLLVQSEYGQAESSQLVTVGSNPTADIMLEESAVTGSPFHGQAYADGSVTAIRWQMGDGRSYRGERVSHTYRRPGDYQVTMTAENDFGETQVVRSVHVELGTAYLYLPQIAYGSGARSLANRTDPAAVEGTVVTVPPTGEAAPPAPVIPAAPTPAAAGGAGVVVETVEAPLPQQPQPAQQPQPPAQQQEPQPQPAAQQQQQPQPQPAAQEQQPEQFDIIVLPPQSPLDPSASPAEQLLWYINEARRLHGLPALAYNYELSIAAQMHTVDMAGNPEIMHDGSDGSRPAERQRRYGYPGSYGGEAVAWGWESPVPVVEFWVNSPPHRALILNPAATEVGVGFTADGRAPNLWYWAAEFGIR